MKFSILSTAIVSLACGAASASAQEDVVRRSYAFLADDIRIEVQTQLAGSIQLVRGGRATIDIAARVPDGIAAFGLGDRTTEILRLSATGAGSANFVVTVPERVNVSLWLPGNTDPVSVGLSPAELQRWSARGGAPAPEPGPAGIRIGVARGPAARTAPPATFGTSFSPAPTYVSDRAPHVVSIPDPLNVRNVSVRIEGSDFRVGSSEPLRTIPGNMDRLEIRTHGPPIDLVLQLPADVAGFMLKVGSEVAFAVNDGDARAFCSPVTTQDIDGGARWFDFTPRDGRLLCQP
jgi:hypothetical protein